METFFLSVLSSAMVAAGLAMAIMLLGGRLGRPAVLHLLWVVVLVKLFVPPVLTFGLLPAEPVVPVAVEGALIGVAEIPIEMASAGPTPWVMLGWSLLALWAAGSLTVLALSLIRLRRFSKTLGTAHPVAPELAERIEILAKAVGCSRRPLAVMTDESVSPMVWSGFGGPRLLLPQRLVTRLNDGQLETILAHELAHLKRGDDRVRWIELAALIVFWWNPTTWVASRFLRDAEEACCDAIVARTLPTQIEDYAHGLVQAVRHLVTPEPSPLVAASGLGRPALIERRIRTMFSKKTFLPLSVPARFVLILTAVMTLGLSPMLTAREPGPDDLAGPPTILSDEPINLNLENADVRDVLATFSKIGNVEIVVDPAISETITIELKGMPLNEAFQVILGAADLVAVVDGGRIIVGKAAALETGPNPDLQPKIEGDIDGRPLYRHIVDGLITAPKRLDGPNPRYPEQARAEGINGVIVLDCVVAEDGSVREIEVKRSTANVLSEAAVEAVEQWIFEPATLEGVPVAVRYVVTVNFQLK